MQKVTAIGTLIALTIGISFISLTLGIIFFLMAIPAALKIKKI